jgi:hypothetical protein
LEYSIWATSAIDTRALRQEMSSASPAKISAPRPKPCGGDDPAPFGVVLGVADVGVARQRDSVRKVRRLGWVADQVGLEWWRLDLGLQPGHDDVFVRNSPKVVHLSAKVRAPATPEVWLAPNLSLDERSA